MRKSESRMRVYDVRSRADQGDLIVCMHAYCYSTDEEGNRTSDHRPETSDERRMFSHAP